MVDEQAYCTIISKYFLYLLQSIALTNMVRHLFLLHVSNHVTATYEFVTTATLRNRGPI